MTLLSLKLDLKSVATFGRGDGLAGVVNVEVQHDADGFPYLSGKTLKGLLAVACAEILDSLRLIDAQLLSAWHNTGQRLFGNPGSQDDQMGILHVGDATLPTDLRAEVSCQIENGEVTPEDVLQTLTALRRQTAMDAVSGAPKAESLRSIRVILPDLAFTSSLNFSAAPSPEDLALLAACAHALRRAGTGRNRGRGRLIASLIDKDDQPITEEYFKRFEETLKP